MEEVPVDVQCNYVSVRIDCLVCRSCEIRKMANHDADEVRDKTNHPSVCLSCGGTAKVTVLP
jgi:hypothetical protein